MTLLFFIIYNVLILAGILIVPLFLLVIRPSYLKHGLERLGRVPRLQESVWIHTASVGEVKASVPLIERIISSGNRVLLTTVTPAGRQYASTLRIQGLSVSYAPLDNILFTLYAVRRSCPKTLIIIETELWPNMILAAALNRVKIVSVNARLTYKAFRAYRVLGPVLRSVLRRFTLICAQTPDDRDRFVKLGAAPTAVRVTGNIKYAIGTNGRSDPAEKLKKTFPGRQIIVAGSTHQGEEKIVADCFLSLRQVFKSLLLILAPRHLDRTGEVELLLRQAGLRFLKRSSMDTAGTAIQQDAIDVLLLDTIGELADIYSIGDAVFVGGSLVPVGGHNLLEVVVHKKPVIFGHYTDTIKEFVSLLDGSGGIMVHDQAELCAAISNLLEHPQQAQELGEKAFMLIKQKVDTLNNIMALMKSAGVL